MRKQLKRKKCSCATGKHHKMAGECRWTAKNRFVIMETEKLKHDSVRIDS